MAIYQRAKSKAAALEALSREIVDSNICSSLAAEATNLVMGYGDPDADIVLIGEAPGKKEDESGLPFVGASGRFLDEMLGAISLSREDIYITNIVKYRPPANRDPSEEEKKEFWPFLLRQLEVIEPKLIVTLGRHSGMVFLPDLQISRDHGSVQNVLLGGKEYLIMPLYHPAAALYNGSMRQVLMDDFVKIAEVA